MVLLEDDVKELADAHVYLDPANEKAPLAPTSCWARRAGGGSRLSMRRRSSREHGDQARRCWRSSAWSRPAARRRSGSDRAAWWNGRRASPPMRDAGGAVRREARHGAAAPGAAPSRRRREPALRPPRSARREPPRPSPMPAMDLPVAEQPEQPSSSSLNAEDRSSKRRLQAPTKGGPKANRRQGHRAIRELRPPGLRPVRAAQRADRLRRNPLLARRLATDAKTGEATVQFGLNDAVTSFRVFADAFSAGGAGGRRAQVESVEPFYVEPKMPLEVTRAIDPPADRTGQRHDLAAFGRHAGGRAATGLRPRSRLRCRSS